MTRAFGYYETRREMYNAWAQWFGHLWVYAGPSEAVRACEGHITRLRLKKMARGGLQRWEWPFLGVLHELKARMKRRAGEMAY